jgi:uncharacterized membrane protein YhaH (DUF805 family)
MAIFALPTTQPNVQLPQPIRKTRMFKAIFRAFADATNPDIAKFALTPYGRTGRLRPRRRTFAWLPPTDPLLKLCVIAFFAYPIIIPIIWRLLGLGLEESVLLGALIPVLFFLYSTICWNIRRLHDINQSGVRILSSMLFHFGVLATPILMMLAYFLVVEFTSVGQSADWQEQVWLTVWTPVIAMMLSPYIYYGTVLSAHKRRWKRDVTNAPGDDFPNAHGLPPKQSEPRSLIDGI